MTKQQAISWLAKSPYTCHHLNTTEVVYQKRLYAICKTCLAKTVMAVQTIEGSQPDDPVVAYTIYQSEIGYQPEIFHATDFSTYWTGSWYATKQKAYEAAQAQLLTMH